MKRLSIIAVLFILAFMLPMTTTLPVVTNNPNQETITEQDDMKSRYAVSDISSGGGMTLPVTMTGTLTNTYDGQMVIDSSDSGETTITTTDGWTGSNLDSSINDLSLTIDNTLENGKLDDYHNEKWLISGYESEDVGVPNSWTLTKDISGGGSTHPHYGTFELNRFAGSGYQNSEGWRFDADWSSGTNIGAGDTIYISQMVSLPYRDIQSATLSFYYNVDSASSMRDDVFVFVRIAGYETEFHVFESGDTTSSWLQTSVSLTSGQLNTISLPDSVLVEIGIATDLSGFQSNSRTYHVYLDEIQLSTDVRPFPEQVGLKANGTLVQGAIEGSIYNYVPDDSNRDAYDDNTNGIDLNGYNNNGQLDVGIWSNDGTWPNAFTFQVGMQFPLTIPQGAAITSAWVEVEAATSSNTPDMRIYIAGEDTSSQPITNFTSGTPHMEDRYNWVDTSIDWDVSGWTSPVTIRQKTPDLSGLIQEIVSSSSWNETYYVCVMLDYMYSSSNQAYNTIKGSSNYAQNELARLFVEYMIPLPEDEVTTFAYEKDITIDQSMVAGPLTDFPVMINITDSDLKSKAQSDGDDIAFSIDGKAVDFEIEYYDPEYSVSEAHLVAWVKVPYLSSSSDTIITMHYGNPDARPMSSTAVWDGYETVHHLNHDPTGVTYDSTANNHDGTSYGSMTSDDLTTGLVDGAVDFDGSDDVISIGQIETDSWNSFTQSIWVYRDTATDCRVFSKSYTTSANQHILSTRIDTNNVLTVRLWTDGTGGSGASYSTGATVSLNQWHHIVWSWDASTGNVIVYVDGNLAYSTTHDGDTIYNADEMFTIGNVYVEAARNTNGTLDEVRLTQSVLTEDWIDTEYNNHLNPSSYISVGSERSVRDTWSDDDQAKLVMSTTSPDPVTLDIMMTMDIEGSGQSLDENMEPGSTYYMTNGSAIVDWVAHVLISPPAEATSMMAEIAYPMTEWNPTKILDPLSIELTYGTDWTFDGGIISISLNTAGIWGVYELQFQSWNYVENALLGHTGLSLAETDTYDIGDSMKVKVTTPWITDARVGMILTDPSGTEWYTAFNTTTGSASHEIPSFKYRKTITVESDYVAADVDNFPFFISILDTDLFDTSKVQSDGDDILFIQNGQILSHEITSFIQNFDGSRARLQAWIAANLSSTVDTPITMYYGNPVVGSQESVGNLWSEPSYEGVWHLEEAATAGQTSAIHYDSTTTDADGNQNGNARNTGRAGYAQQFDGTNDQIVVNASLGPSPPADATISGWFRLDNSFNDLSSTSQLIVSKYYSDYHDMHIALVGQDYGGSNAEYGALGFKVENDPNWLYKYTTITSWAANTWYHFACFIDSDNPSNHKIYIDGVDRTSTTSGGSSSYANISYAGDLQFGGGVADSQVDNRWLDGRMDEMRISSTSRSTGWLRTEYLNLYNLNSFVSVGSENQRTSPEATFTKTITSDYNAGLWTLTTYFNDTGTTVTNATGIYERNFIVQHDSSLSLISPTDAISDKVAVEVAGNQLMLEVELTDDVTSNGITGAEVTINWTVSDVATEVTLDEYDDGRYGKVLDTDDLGHNQRWRINIGSYHPYYNNATDYFDLDLYHETKLTYKHVETTPTGFDFTATLVYWDVYDNVPITGASISFDNGTAITPDAEGSGEYNISLSSSSYNYGDHIFTFNATKSSSYLLVGQSDVIFTLRKHYTAVSVTGDLLTPYGETTELTIILIDLDTGTSVPIGDVASFTFTPDVETSEGETSPISDYIYTMGTDDWSVKTEGVTLSVSLAGSQYYDPDDYSFDITIRKHYTALSINANLTTPYGFTTDISVILIDLDTGGTVAIGNVYNITFDPTGYGSDSETDPIPDYDFTLATSSWSVGTVSVTLIVDMTGSIYNNPDDYVFEIIIRKRMTSMSVSGDFVTPFGESTDVTVTITDLDTGSTVTIGNVYNITFDPTGYTSYSETDPISDYEFTLDTSSWSVGTVSVTLIVDMTGSNYDSPDNYVFSIQIRKHYTSVTVIGNLTTPHGFTTDLTVILTDLDTGSTVTIGNVYNITFDPTGYTSYSETDPISDYEFTLDTSSWSVGTVSVILIVDMAGSDYVNPTNYAFNIIIRKHFTSVSISGDFITPFGENTTVTISLIDTDTGGTVATTDVVSWTFTPDSNPVNSESSPSDYEFELDTDGWVVSTDSITFSVDLSGSIYIDPDDFVFSVTIRKHYTSVTVTGDLTTPYGNDTTVTVVITDLDTATTIGFGAVNYLNFTWTGGYNDTASALMTVLQTNTWNVGSTTVTLDVSMIGSNYFDPTDYDFSVTITPLEITLYHEPTDLIFPQEDDFELVLRVNVSEPGQYHGDIVPDLVQAEFTVRNSTYTYTITLYEIGTSTGRYNLTISWVNNFFEGDYTITIRVNPVDSRYKSDSLVVTFNYRPARSELSSPDRAAVTPFETNYTISLNFTDIDRDSGISGATITIDGVTSYVVYDLGGGLYEVSINVDGMSKGEHLYDVTADADGYEAQTIEFKVIIRIAYTYAIPTTGALDVPVGNSPVFYVDYWDIDHDEAVTGATVTDNWTARVDIAWTGSRYKVTFNVPDNTTLGTYLVMFTFSKGENYQEGQFNISVVVRTHNTDFRLVSAIEPTSFNGQINISVFYGDLDSGGAGIAASNVTHAVWNGTNWVTSSFENDTSLGVGYYLIAIPASQFGGLGLQNFTVYFNWTGSVYKYQNKTLIASVNIIGEDSKLTLLLSSEPTPYLDNMTYTFFYAELYSGDGITNTSSPYGDGNVHISVSFQGLSVDLSQVDIWEIDSTNNPGEYRIRFDTEIFSDIGVIYMNVFINWSKGVEPFYTNRTDTITVRILARDTQLAVVPASATPYAENATFSFTFEDSLLNTEIANASNMMITLSLSYYNLTYNETTLVFTVYFNTSQFGETIGQKSFTLGVEWVGAPFYANKTGRILYVTVTTRDTVVDFQAPAPTPYLNNVTFTVTWTDVTGASTSGIELASLILYDGVTAIDTIYYNVTEIGNGEYSIEFNTTYYTTPGTYSLKLEISSTKVYYATKTTTRDLIVQFRNSILTTDPIADVAYNSSIIIQAYFQDSLTGANIVNNSDIVFTIETGSNWIFTCEWQPSLEYYLITIETYNQAGLEIGVDYNLRLRMTYAYQSPFYDYDDVIVTYEIRYRDSTLDRVQSPVQTPYLDTITFSVLYTDADGNSGITGATIYISEGGTLLTSGVDYTFSDDLDGYYTINVDTTALDGLGSTNVRIYANWTGTPYHDNASLSINLVVTRRVTDIVVVSTPSRTSYNENVTFVVTFNDLGTGSTLSVTKNLLTLYIGTSSLFSSDWSFTEISTDTYEVQVLSTKLTTVLASGLNVTLHVDWPDSPNYYQDDSTSVSVTIIARTTAVTIERPASTAYGENATLELTFIDTTETPEEVIDSPLVDRSTNLTETPTWTYSAGTGIWTLSFDTAQFGEIGEMVFHINVTWVGSPFYANKTLRIVYVVIIERQTQVEFDSPTPTPYGDNVNFTIEYIDIAGATDTGIDDATLTLYYLGSPINSLYYDYTKQGNGVFEVEFNSSFFANPDSYDLNVSLVYDGLGYKADGYAIRSLRVLYRSTLASAEPAGSIGYATIFTIEVSFIDSLTLAVVGNGSGYVTFTITNNTETWEFNITWNGADETYTLSVDTDGHPGLELNKPYRLYFEMSYDNVVPFYRSDDSYISFTIRQRTSILDITEPPTPTSYLEFAEVTIYYLDTDENQGISGSSIVVSTTVPLTLNVDYFVTPGDPGYYLIQLNTSVWGALGSFTVTITITGDWSDAIAPYHADASRNTTIRVIRRTTNVEILSPPSNTMYLDNLTLTFEYVDTTNFDSPMPISITSDDIVIYADGAPLGPTDFVLTPFGSAFILNINSTVFGEFLVTNLNLTIVVDWDDGTSPFYEDDQTYIRVSTTKRNLAITLGQIETTPYGDNMTIEFTVEDSNRLSGVGDLIILFECTNLTLIEGFNFWITEGTGVNEGLYTINVDTGQFLGDVGNYQYTLRVQWNQSQVPFYRNLTAITLTGSVDLIWTNLQNDLPDPSPVQYTGNVSILVYFTDLDHEQVGIDVANTTFTVVYVSSGIAPEQLRINPLGNGVYNISFSTENLPGVGSVRLNITVDSFPYEPISITPSLTISAIQTTLEPLEATIQLSWTELADITFYYLDNLHDNLTVGAELKYNWIGGDGVLVETSPGVYEISIDTALADAGTRVITFNATKDNFQFAIATITLVVATLPSDIDAIVPSSLVEDINRGSPVVVTLYLNDTFNNAAIDDEYVNEVKISFITGTFYLSYTGTAGIYNGSIPGDSTILSPGFYSVIITCTYRNYNPASYQFKINLKETPTVLSSSRYGNATALETVFSTQFNLTLALEAPTIDYIITDGIVNWTIPQLKISGDFINLGNGSYVATFNTTGMFFGVWAVTVRAYPDNKTLAETVRGFTLTINQITTITIREVIPDRYWGWVGNVSVQYYDISFERGIGGANVTYTWEGGSDLSYDLGNGTYLIPIYSNSVLPDSYNIKITFTKENHQVGTATISIIIRPVPTELIATAPSMNYIPDSTTSLELPINETVTITLYYNDTDNSDGYIGGLEGANFGSSVISSDLGTAFVIPLSIEVSEIGDGYYEFSFDTNLVRFNVKIGYSYTITFIVNLANRTRSVALMKVKVIEMPTVIEIIQQDINIMYGEIGEIWLNYTNGWPAYEGQPIRNANLSLDYASQFLTFSNPEERSPGIYVIQYTAGSSFVPSDYAIPIEVQLNITNHEIKTLSFIIIVAPTPEAQTLYNSTILGTPILLFILILVGLWIKVWSVPKKLRQINGQIKQLRKGKIPKPIDDAKPREALVAELFNDTYEDYRVGDKVITRKPDQMPSEAVAVEVPEMGELLIQLSILTNLSPEELDEFKADISKMKISEQAAFVKEVIMQEAIRAARRENKTVEDIIEDIEHQARVQLSGEDIERVDRTKAPTEEEPILLLDDEVTEEVTPIDEEEEISESAREIIDTIRREEVATPSEMMSEYEIGELRKELVQKGVPPHEIDTILEQARTLPRELVEELLKSLEDV